MIKQESIDELIAQIPAIPAILKSCENTLASGDLAKAAAIAKNDLALVEYMRSIINKPIFGFKKEIKDISQIFSALGADRTTDILYSYYVLLTTPKKWKIFNLDTQKFANLQANFMIDWGKILKEIKVDNKDIFKSITIIPSSISVCEKIFSENAENLKHVLRTSGLSYNTILKREIGFDIFEICCKIAEKWQLSNIVVDIFQNLSKQEEQTTITKYIHLLISYELSKPEFANSGFGEMFEFNCNASPKELETFMKAIGYETKN
ncbi:HDOD domain-containing protein [Campylobacter sp. RM16187]|uniref:HDOD domain-containing protein n=1 Tax=Campylobacter sp. RM16187 TaxID=1660063 RepID=UPI0021B5D55F|nr:HDOD domain-containing protein [Campylobacter sp. RM16187]QKG29580.1 hypothetical protein CDOMF_1327 [Campylobacter sp. RM16187]